MKKFIELGNRYAARSDWRDFALTKFCLWAIGVMIGVNIPAKYSKKALIVAVGVFVATYIPLMKKVFGIVKDMTEDRREK